MIDSHDWNHLVRFAVGECTAEEAEEAARRAADDAAQGKALAFIRDIDIAMEAGKPQWDTDAAWRRLAACRSARMRSPFRLVPARGGRRKRRWPSWATAAAVLATVAALFGLWRSQRVAAPSSPATASTGAMSIRSTLPGQRAAFRLPDGSRVILAPASRLRYPASYQATAGRREVYLEGLALFEVAHDARRPFLVHTVRGVAEDLGTRFTVQEYPGDSLVQVVVAEGSVELRSAAQTAPGVFLRAGQLGMLSRNGDALVRSNVDLARWLAWIQDRLIFDDTPLRDVLPQLARWYGLEFVLGDSTIGARHLTASLGREAVSETLALFSATLDLTYTRHGRTITFFPRDKGR